MPRRDPRREQSSTVRPADEPEDAALVHDLAEAINQALDQVDQINAQGVHEYKDPARYVAKMLVERSSFRIGRKSTSIGGESVTYTVSNPRIVYVSAILPVPRGTTVRNVPLRATANVASVIRDILVAALRAAGVSADAPVRVSEEPWTEPCQEPVVGARDVVEIETDVEDPALIESLRELMSGPTPEQIEVEDAEIVDDDG